MIKKQFLFTSVILMLAITTITAQQSKSFNSSSYTTAIGIKFYPGALSIKHFVNDNAALEGLAYFWNKGFRATGLYEIHYDISGAEGLKWYIGPGAHLGGYNDKYGGGVSLGIDGVLGLDYKFSAAPINLSLDWQPYFEFGGGDYNGFNGSWAGLGIRYTL
jgi:hypothetical protein